MVTINPISHSSTQTLRAPVTQAPPIPPLSFDLTDIEGVLNSFIASCKNRVTPFGQVFHDPKARLNLDNMWETSQKIRDKMLPFNGECENLYKALFSFLPKVNDPSGYWNNIPIEKIAAINTSLMELMRYTVLTGNISGLIYTECLYAIICHLTKRELISLYRGFVNIFTTVDFGTNILSKAISEDLPYLTCPILKDLYDYLLRLHGRKSNKREENAFYCSEFSLLVLDENLRSSGLYRVLLRISEDHSFPLSCKDILSIFEKQQCQGIPDSFWIMWNAYQLRVEPGLLPAHYPIQARSPNSLFLMHRPLVGNGELVQMAIENRLKQVNNPSNFPKLFKSYFDKYYTHDEYNYYLFRGIDQGENLSVTMVAKEFTQILRLRYSRFAAAVDFIRRYQNEPIFDDNWEVIKGLFWYHRAQMSDIFEPTWIKTVEEQQSFNEALEFLFKFLTDLYLTKFNSITSDHIKLEIMESVSKGLIKNNASRELLLEQVVKIAKHILPAFRKGALDFYVLNRWVRWIHELSPSEETFFILETLRILNIPGLPYTATTTNISDATLDWIAKQFLLNVTPDPTVPWVKTNSLYTKGPIGINTNPFQLIYNNSVANINYFTDVDAIPLFRKVLGSFELTSKSSLGTLRSVCRNYIVPSDGFIYVRSTHVKQRIQTLYPRAKEVISLCDTIDYWVMIPLHQVKPLRKSLIDMWVTNPTRLILQKINGSCEELLIFTENYAIHITYDGKNGVAKLLNENAEVYPPNMVNRFLQLPYFRNFPHKNGFNHVYITTPQQNSRSTLYLADYNLSFILEPDSQGTYRLKSVNFPGYYVQPTPFNQEQVIPHLYLSTTASTDDKLLVMRCENSDKLSMIPFDEEGLPIGNTIEENIRLLMGIAIPCEMYEYGRKLIRNCLKGRQLTKKEIKILTEFLKFDSIAVMKDLPEMIILKNELFAVLQVYRHFQYHGLSGSEVSAFRKEYRHTLPHMRLTSPTMNLIALDYNTTHSWEYLKTCKTIRTCGLGTPVNVLLHHNKNANKEFIGRVLCNHFSYRPPERSVPTTFDALLAALEPLFAFHILEYALKNPSPEVKSRIKIFAARAFEKIVNERNSHREFGDNLAIISILLYVSMTDEVFLEIQRVYSGLSAPQNNVEDVIVVLRNHLFDYIQDKIISYIKTRSDRQNFPDLDANPDYTVIGERTALHTPPIKPRLSLLSEYNAHFMSHMQAAPSISDDPPLLKINIFEGVIKRYFKRRVSAKKIPESFRLIERNSQMSPASRELIRRIAAHCETHPPQRIEWYWRKDVTPEMLRQEIEAIIKNEDAQIESEAQAIRVMLNGNELADIYESPDALYQALRVCGTTSIKVAPITIEEIQKWISLTTDTAVPDSLKQRIRNLMILKMRQLTAQKALSLLTDIPGNEEQLIEFMRSCKQLQISHNNSDILLQYQLGRGLVLRKDQMHLLANATEGTIACQAASGMGKSDVIIPLLLTQQQRKGNGKRWIMIGPDSLHETTLQRLNQLLPKTGFTEVGEFRFSRNLEEPEYALKSLYNPERMTPTIGKLTSFQSLLLHFFQTLLSDIYEGEWRDNMITVIETVDVLRHLHNETRLLNDEVHEIMDPLKSLHYAHGEDAPVAPDRWKMGLTALNKLVDINFDFHLPEATFSNEVYYAHLIDPIIDEYIAKQSSIFVDIIDPLTLRHWLKFHKNKYSVNDVENFNEFQSALTEKDRIQLYRLRTYLHVYIPHCLQAKYLSKYGPVPHSEFPAAYNGNGNPTNARFANADVELLLTALMTLKGGLIEAQMLALIKTLKSIRAVSKTNEAAPSSSTSTQTVSPLSHTVCGDIYNLFEDPIETIDETSPHILQKYHERLKHNPKLVLTYLELNLFPTATEGMERLSANAQDVAIALFPESTNLAATLNNSLFYPVGMQVEFDPQTDSDIVAELTNPNVCQVVVSPRENWADTIAANNILVLADPCDILKGNSNENIAEIILKKRDDLHGVIIFDSETKEPCIVYRDGSKGLYNKSIHKNLKLHAYLDGPHCTGSDFSFPTDCRMVILVDKDLTWTHYAQTAKRLRKLGENKQTFIAAITTECAQQIALFEKTNPENYESTPQLQLMQLTFINEGTKLETGLYPSLMNMITAFFRRQFLREFIDVPTEDIDVDFIEDKILGLGVKKELMRETQDPEDAYRAGKIELPISLAQMVENRVQEYTEKFPTLAAGITKELEWICERARKILSSQYFDASSASLHAGVEIETQSQTQNHDFGFLSPDERSLSASDPIKIRDINLSDLLHKLTYNSPKDENKVNYPIVWNLSRALKPFHPKFDEDLYITDNALNSLAPKRKNIWGIHTNKDAPKVAERKIDAALKLTKTVAGFLEVVTQKDETVWILLSIPDIENFYGTNKIDKHNHIQRYVLRDCQGKIRTESGEGRPSDPEKVSRIVSQIAIYNTNDFIQKSLRPHLKRWLLESDPEAIERFYVRLRSQRFNRSPIVYESTEIFHIFRKTIRKSRIK